MLLWGLEELASEPLQRSLWLGYSQNEQSSFEEAVCHVFDDSSLARALAHPEGGEQFSADVKKAFDRLFALIDAMPQQASPERILSDPLMPQIRDCAASLWTLLQAT